MDLQSLQVTVALAASVLGILGTIFGWFGKAWKWISTLFRFRPETGVIGIPKKTIILIPVSHQNALWWHMGSIGAQPAMQIVGDLNVTNISNHSIHIMGAKLRKPKAVGHALVRDQTSDMYGSKFVIPEGAVSDLRFDFFVQPPVCTPGEPFKADVAIIDQFGNEHWLRNLEFPYT